MSRDKNSQGFTLVELLLVTSLAGVIFLALTTSFFMGLKVFDRLSGLVREEEFMITVERISTDLGNLAESAVIPFEVNDSSISFAMMAEDFNSIKSDSSLTGRPLRVTYQFDESRHEISRTVDDPIYRSAENTQALMAGSVKSMRFRKVPNDGRPEVVTLTIEAVIDRSLRSFKKDIMIPSTHAQMG